jgi:hypothetical protein
MSVAARVVFCEGTAGGADVELLTRLLLGLGCQIKPLGGKFGGTSFARDYAQASGARWYFFRDRDFDAEPRADGGLIADERHEGVFLSGLPCLESYFLDAHLLARVLNMPEQAEELHERLIRAARDIAAYQAVRWALQACIQHVRDLDLRLPNRLTNEDGKLPTDLSLDACRQEAQTLLERYQVRAAQVDTLPIFVRELDRYQALFHEEGFYDEGRYRLWFHGKDVLYRWLHGLKKSDKYVEKALSLLKLDDFPDLMEFRERVRDDERPSP